MPEPYRARISPRWSDQDLNGHVNHAAVVTLLEEARIQWRATTPGTRTATAAPTVVAALELNYRRPVIHGQELTVELTVSRIGTSSYTLECAATQSGEVAVHGRTVLVAVSPETGAARPLAAAERSWLAEFQPSPCRTDPSGPQISHPTSWS